jgi:hypothetical protein
VQALLWCSASGLHFPPQQSSVPQPLNLTGAQCCANLFNLQDKANTTVLQLYPQQRSQGLSGSKPQHILVANTPHLLCSPPLLTSSAHHRSPPLTITHHRSPPLTTAHHRSPLLTTAHHCSPPLTTAHHCSPLLTTAHHCSAAVQGQLGCAECLSGAAVVGLAELAVPPGCEALPRQHRQEGAAGQVRPPQQQPVVSRATGWIEPDAPGQEEAAGRYISSQQPFSCCWQLSAATCCHSSGSGACHLLRSVRRSVLSTLCCACPQ